MRKTLVILAAGMGSRFGGLKQLEPVGPSGEFLLDYAVYDAIQAGFCKVVFVIRREMEAAFDASLGERIRACIPVEYVYQDIFCVPPGYFMPAGRKKPWGTAHAVLVSRPAVDGVFAVINADDYYGREAFQQAAAFLERTGEVKDRLAMVGYQLQNTLSEHGAVSRGICQVRPDGLLQHIVERQKIRVEDGQICFEDGANRVEYLSGATCTSMNMWAFKPCVYGLLEDAFKKFLDTEGKQPQSEFFISSIINQWVAASRVTVEVLASAERWFGVTYPQDKETVVACLRERVACGMYPERLWDPAALS